MARFTTGLNLDLLLAAIIFSIAVLIISFCTIKLPAVSTEATNASRISVKITFPPPGQQVPINIGLTLFGTASYTWPGKDCTVYASSNNNGFRKVVAVGPTADNYSSWLFTLSRSDIGSSIGLHKLVAKLTCKASPANITAYYVSNYTGIVAGNAPGVSSTSHRHELPGWGPKIISNNDHNSYLPGLPFLLPKVLQVNNDSQIFSPPQESKQLGLTLVLSKNPIGWGEIQTVKIFVFDRYTKHAVPNAVVTVSTQRPGVGIRSSSNFTINSDKNGVASYSWVISDLNQKATVFKLIAHAYANGYNFTTGMSNFTAMIGGLKSETHDNFTNNLNDFKNPPGISTIHEGT